MTSISYPGLFLSAIFLCFAVAVTGCQEAKPVPESPQHAASENEELARQYIEAYNARNLTALQEILGDPITMNGQEYARGDFLEATQGYWQAFPDIELQPTHIAGGNDHVTVRMDFTATGKGEYSGHDVDEKTVRSSEIVLFYVNEGQLAEYWSNWDELGFWTQLGALESPYPEQ